MKTSKHPPSPANFVSVETALQLAADLAALVSKDGGFIALSPGFKSLLALDAPQGKGLVDFLERKDERENFVRDLESVHREGKVRQRLYRLKDKDGRTRLIASRLYPKPEGVDGPAGAFFSCFDTTALEGSEADFRLKREESARIKALLQDVMDGMLTGLLVLALDGEVITINRMAREILRAGDADYSGADVSRICLGLTPMFEVLEPLGRSREISVTLASGDEIPLGFNNNYLRDSRGKTIGVVAVFKDLTEIKRMRRELEAKEKLAAIGQLAGGIAHEIKNPLFAVSSGLQLLELDLDLNEDQRETFDIMTREIMRMDRLIRELLSFSAQKSLNKKPFDLCRLIDEVVYLNQGLIKEKGIKTKRTGRENEVTVAADKDKMSQVLLNLIQNAIEASPEGGTITASCSSADDRVVCSIADEGPGISEEDAEKVFDLFYTTKKGNSGMGLALSRRIAHEHGGTLVFKPREKGAEMVLTLPKS